MAQFDVYRNASTATRRAFPYLLDIQNDLLEHLATRVVVPLMPERRFGSRAQRLNPAFEIEGQIVVMSTPELAGVPSAVLGEHVTSLRQERAAIVAALDVIVSGV